MSTDVSALDLVVIFHAHSNHNSRLITGELDSRKEKHFPIFLFPFPHSSAHSTRSKILKLVQLTPTEHRPRVPNVFAVNSSSSSFGNKMFRPLRSTLDSPDSADNVQYENEPLAVEVGAVS